MVTCVEKSISLGLEFRSKRDGYGRFVLGECCSITFFFVSPAVLPALQEYIKGAVLLGQSCRAAEIAASAY